MPIVTTDIKILLSGGAANADPDASLGGAISSEEVVDDSLHNLFDRVQGSESEGGDVEYRLFYVKNNHATLTLQNAKIYINTNTPSTDSAIEIAVAAETGSPVQEIADESTAPTDETFYSADGEENALTIGDLAPGESKGIWVKRTITAGAAAYADDNVIIKVFGDTDE